LKTSFAVYQILKYEISSNDDVNKKEEKLCEGKLVYEYINIEIFLPAVQDDNGFISRQININGIRNFSVAAFPY
jgi:hypothetical protein